MSSMHVGPGFVPGVVVHASASRRPGAIHLRLLLLTITLYFLFLGIGSLVHAREPIISLIMVWLGPLAPLYSAALALEQGLFTESLFGCISLGPAAFWLAAVRWPSHPWLEWAAHLSIVVLYALLFLALGVSA